MGRRRQWWYVARGTLAIALLTAIAFPLQFNGTTTAFMFLIAILLNATGSGFPAAAVVCLVATASLDYFFLVPLFSFRLTDPVEAVMLVAFLLTSLVVTRLGARARAQAEQAQYERNRTAQVHAVTEKLLALDPGESAGEGLLQPFLEVMHLKSVCLLDGETAEVRFLGSSNSELPAITRDAYIAREDRDLKQEQIAVRCVKSKGEITGALGLEGLEDATMAGPLAAVAASWIQMVKSHETAHQAAADAQAEALRGAVLDALAHEFKTPLTTILAAAGGLRELGPLAPAQDELAELVELEAARLGHLAARLLRTAQLDREQVQPKPEVVNLYDVAQDVADRYAELRPAHMIEVHGNAEATVSADTELLRLALGQLVDNACKYSPEGSTVRIALFVENGLANLTVWSPSRPVSKADRARIFERFGRGGNASAGGSGLGLHVTRKIALAHGGGLVLDPESEQGGMTFRFYLPLENARHDG